VHRMAEKFPFQVSASGELKVADRAGLPLSGSVLGFSCYNPLAPKRFIHVFAPYLATSELRQLTGKCARMLPGADGLHKGDHPDLIVQTVNRVQRRKMQFDQQWQWRLPEGKDRLFPKEFGLRDAFAKAHLTAMRRQAAVDIGLWWGLKDKLFHGHDFNILDNCDPATFSVADYRCKTTPMKSMTASLSGAELRDLHQRWIARGELLTVPAFDPGKLKPEKIYRVVLPHELVVKLGTRKKVLTNVAEGPAVTTEELLREIFPD